MWGSWYYTGALVLHAALISASDEPHHVSPGGDGEGTNKTVSHQKSSSEDTINKHVETGIDSILCEYYSPWTKWSTCNRKCEQTRVRRCRRSEECGRSWLKEKRICKRRKGACSVLSYQVYGFRRRNRYIEQLLYDLLYDSWTEWGPCSRTCKQKRTRNCVVNNICRDSYIQEERRCSVEESQCERRYMLKPISNDDSPNKGKDAALGGDKAHHHKPTHHKKKKKKKRPQPPSLTEVQKTCGLRPANMSGSFRIVGGREAHRLSWPWQVGIMTKYEEQYCGGTLIAPQWVLTAAHCIRKKGRKRRVLVRIGEHDFGAYEGTETTQRPSKDFPHPKFDYSTITNDIGLIKLKKPVPENPGIGFACLPEADDDLPPKTLCYTVGWGKLKNTHVFGSPVLQEAKIPIVSRPRCQRVFNYDITDTQVCAGFKRGGVDSCAGDSGGPLLCSQTVNNTERWFVYGITSYGEGCGRRGKFGIYTKVPKFVNWIRDIIGKND